MKECSHYVVAWLIAGRRLFMLWHDGGAEPDKYAVRSDGSRLLSAESIEELIEVGRERGLELDGQLAHTVDFDAAMVVLTRLRTARPLSQRSCSLLLDVWNALEDASHSIGTALLASDSIAKVESDRLYEMIFFGNNLPAMTPDGKKYQPVLNSNEQKFLRNALRMAVDKLTAETRL